MVVQGINNWPVWRVTCKHNGRTYGSMLVVAPTGKDAVEAAKVEASSRWGWPEQLVWNCKRAGVAKHNVVHYV